MESKTHPAQHCLLEKEAHPCPPPAEGFPLCTVHAHEIDRRYAFRLAENAFRDFIEKGDGAFLFSRRDGSVFALNVSAALIFRRLAEGVGLSSILREISDSFEGASPEEILKDAIELIDRLKEAGVAKMDLP